MLNLQSYYRDQMKWSAGPHLFVADDLIWVFTPLTTSGIHSPSWNAISWGVEIVGEYDDETFGGGVRTTAIDALAALHQWRGLDPLTLHFHKEDPLTTHKNCPGKNIVKSELISAIQSRLVGLNQGEHLAAPIASGAAAPPAARKARRTYGWKPDLPDHRDYPYGAMRLGLESPATLPSSVDLRPSCPPVYDQGKVLQSCTANALAAALKFLELKSGRPKVTPSRLFIYYNERSLENDTGNNAPAYLRDGIKSIATTGICDESAWPYDELEYAQQPPASCYQQAQTYKALSYFSVDNSKLEELKGCLASGFPFVFGFSLYPSFYDADSNRGIVPLPGDESIEGGHAVLAVGYDDATARFTIQNSWGADVGDRGYYYMPYQYLTSNLSDSCWTIRSVSGPASANKIAQPQPATVAGMEAVPASTAPIEPMVGLARDMAEAKKYLAFIKEAATKYTNLSPSLLCALGSRESNWGLSPEMKPPGPAGTGDWAPRDPSRFGYAMPPDGLGWGRGLLQIDYQQSFAQTGNWRDPQANILYGASELSGNITYFSKTATSKGFDPMRAGIAAYNCGRGNVTNALKRNYDIDHYTANNNYSQDVLNRMKWFQEEGFDQLTSLSPAAVGAAAPAPANFTVHHGKRYQATVTLNWFEQQIATNEAIEGQFSKLGFSNVTATGNGSTRQVTGLWTGQDATVPLDPHLSNVVEFG